MVVLPSLALAGADPAQGKGGVVGQGARRHVPRRLLVKFRAHVSEPAARQALQEEGAEQEGELSPIGVKLVKLPAEAHETAFLKAFAGRADVAFAELDELHAPVAVPNDPYYGIAWHLPKIGAPAAWDLTRGSGSVTVAILDTGVDGTHPDLASKLVPGWNFYNNNADSSDVYGHGTAVAGTVAAATNNGLGVAAVAWDCSLMPLRISDPQGYASTSTIGTALIWAADHGARVANVSYRASTNLTVQTAAQYFQNHGGVVSISAGNNAVFDTNPDNPYVLTVSATDSTDALTTWSNTGNLIDLAAPGLAIPTTNRGGGYGSWSGTSFSAPVVAGVAALVIAANPSLSGAQVQEVLKQSADDLGSTGWDPSYGWGRVNAARAVSLAAGMQTDTIPPTVSFSFPLEGATLAGTVNVAVSASDGSGVASVALFVDGTAAGTDTSAPFVFTWNTLTMPNGVHTLDAVAVDPNGNSATARVVVTVDNPPDTVAPVIVITSPVGGTVNNPISVLVNATDNLAVVRVELFVDGQYSTSSSSAPFTTRWNPRKSGEGQHSLQCRAFDAAGNVGLSQVVVVTVTR
jgi:subtilisin family serine protease